MSRTALLARKEILQRSLDPFWRNGFDGTSLRHLEEATGLNPGSIYYHFRNKEDLFEQVLSYYIENHLLSRLKNYRRRYSPLESLRRFFTTSYRQNYVEEYCCNCLLVMAMTDARRATLAPILKRAINQMEAEFTELLCQAGKSKDHGSVLIDHYIALQLSGPIKGSWKQRDRYVKEIFSALPEKRTQVPVFTE